jgi:hypothetical protein
MTMPSKRRLAELERRQAKRAHVQPALVILQEDLERPGVFWQDDRLLTDEERRKLNDDPHVQVIQIVYDRAAASGRV